MLNLADNINNFFSVREEVEFVANNISNNTAIIILNSTSRFYSAIRSELQYRSITFNDFTKEHSHLGCSNLVFIAILHWIEWQYKRNVFHFLKFCNDTTNTLNLFSEETVIELYKNLKHAAWKTLSIKYDVLAKQLDPQIFEKVNEYDLGLEDLCIIDFLIKYEKIWENYVSDEHIRDIKNLFASHDFQQKISLETLLSTLSHFLLEKIQSSIEIKNKPQTCSTSLIPIDLIRKNIYSNYFCSLTDYKSNTSYIDRWIKILSGKQNFVCSCCVEADSSLASKNTKPIITNKTTDIAQTKIAYESRNNSSIPFDKYSYILPFNQTIPLACKTIEIFFKNPKKFFYENFAVNCKLNTLHLQMLKRTFIGSLVHELLNISPNKCIEIPTLLKFNEEIEKKFTKYCQMLCAAHSKASILHLDFSLQEALNISKYIAYKFADKISSSGYKYISTEIPLPSNTKIFIENDPIYLTGRIDCILSHQPFSLTSPSMVTLNIFDFKTGNYDSLKESALDKQLNDYIGIQVFMYGVALKSLGFKNINVQIMHHDGKLLTPINITYFLSKGERFLKDLNIVLKSRVIGENVKVFSNIGDNIFLPISESERTNEIIATKRSLSFS